MSILIKGMGMPKEGTVFVIDSSGQVWSNEWPTRGYTRLDGVTAVPVPPHGRLIDADALGKVMSEGIAPNVKDGGFKHPFDIIRAVANAPTIIPAEEGE